MAILTTLLAAEVTRRNRLTMFLLGAFGAAGMTVTNQRALFLSPNDMGFSIAGTASALAAIIEPPFNITESPFAPTGLVPVGALPPGVAPPPPQAFAARLFEPPPAVAPVAAPPGAAPGSDAPTQLASNDALPPSFAAPPAGTDTGGGAPPGTDTPGSPPGTGTPGTPGTPPGIAPPGTNPPDASVPEPATWAMMLVGFGAIGMALRRALRRQPKGAAA